MFAHTQTLWNALAYKLHTKLRATISQQLDSYHEWAGIPQRRQKLAWEDFTGLGCPACQSLQRPGHVDHDYNLVGRGGCLAALMRLSQAVHLNMLSPLATTGDRTTTLSYLDTEAGLIKWHTLHPTVTELSTTRENSHEPSSGCALSMRNFFFQDLQLAKGGILVFSPLHFC